MERLLGALASLAIVVGLVAFPTLRGAVVDSARHLESADQGISVTPIDVGDAAIQTNMTKKPPT